MAVTCSECKKEFCKTSNLNRHRREQHGDKNGKNNRKLVKIKCKLCDNLFKRNEHLQLHMDAVHLAGIQKKCTLCEYTTVNKSALRRHMNRVHNKQLPKTARAKSEFKFPCLLCKRKFREKKHLNYHLNRYHRTPVNSRPIIIKKSCPLCTFTADDTVSRKVIKIMYDHFNDSHNLPLKIEFFVFDSVLEFKDWKSNLEEETVSKFTRSNRSSTKRLTYTCHRSGPYQSKARGKRLKSAGSCKINGFCPAAMVANMKDNGQVDVEFINTHIGHKNDPEHIFLSHAERKQIAEKLSGSVPCEKILEEIQGNSTDCELKRIHLTTRKDVLNIKRCFNLTDDKV